MFRSRYREFSSKIINIGNIDKQFTHYDQGYSESRYGRDCDYRDQGYSESCFERDCNYRRDREGGGGVGILIHMKRGGMAQGGTVVSVVGLIVLI